MAINHFTFNGVSSLSQGLYISGGETFNAPEKDYEVVSIPGRSGDLLIDNQRFKNVDLTYPSIVFQNYELNTEEIRAWLLAANGYCRLEDTYHPNEYRTAYFSGPIDIDTTLLQAGECDIVFKCKPQRWLKSGETPTRIEIVDSNCFLWSNNVAENITWNINKGFNGTTSRGYNTTDLIPVEPQKTYGYFSNSTSTGVYLAYYTASKQRIDTSTNFSKPKYGFRFIIIPNNCYYIKVQEYTPIPYDSPYRRPEFDPPSVFLMNELTDVGSDYQLNMVNPTRFNAKPILRVYGTGTITINSQTITINTAGSSYIDIDCEQQNCYEGSTNRNQNVSLTGWPEFKPGRNYVTYTNISKLEIVPRWWTV